MKTKEHGYVYLLEASGKCGRFKIGRTNNPERRIGEHGRSTLIHQCWYRRIAPVTNYKEKERILLSRFGKSRHVVEERGWITSKSHPEWVNLDEAQVSKLEKLIDSWRVCLNGTRDV